MTKQVEIENLNPVFLFSNWRTGGTALAFALRRTEVFHLYTEPFNPTLRDPERAIPAHTALWHSKHPPGEYYFTEFEELLRSGNLVVPDFDSVPYTLGAHDECPVLAAYLESLISHAHERGKSPVFKLEQSEGSASWLAAKFPHAIRVGVVREPNAQLASWLEQASYGNHLFFKLAHTLINENSLTFDASGMSEFIVGDTDKYERIFQTFRAGIDAQHEAHMQISLDISPETTESIEEQLERIARHDPTRIDSWELALRHVRNSLNRESEAVARLQHLRRLVASQTRLAQVDLDLKETAARLAQADLERKETAARLAQADLEQKETAARTHALRDKARNAEARATQLEHEIEILGSDEKVLTMKLLKAIKKRIRQQFSRSLAQPPKEPTSPDLAVGIFKRIYETNYWRGESRSGEGSDLQQTAIIRKELPELLIELNAKSMLDIPCGDFYWMKHVELPVKYIGADIVPELIKLNTENFSGERRKFMHIDVCSDELPHVDLIFSRDLLVHLSYDDIYAAIRNMKKSGATWLLTTTFTGRDTNVNISTGDWRTLNLELSPFVFPAPVRIINEGCTQFDGDYADKSLGLWKLQDLPL